MEFLENISLAKYTTFKIGGEARYFCVVKSEGELQEALDFAKEKDMPVFISGLGSNILLSDRGFSGLVIKMEIMGVVFEKRSKEINDEVCEVLVTVGAGESWDGFVTKTVRNGLWGLENLSGIPGTVGAAPVQNIGAYGAEAKDVIDTVCALDTTSGAAHTFTNSECQFSYRESFFKTPEGKKYVITSVTFKLSKTSKPNLLYKDLRDYFGEIIAGGQVLLEHGRFPARKRPRFRAVALKSLQAHLPSRPLSLSKIRQAVLKIRKGKFPELSKIGTAGSFWKNPIISKQQFEKLKSQYPDIPFFPGDDKIKIPLAWIFDNICGLKGYTKGNVGLWKNQPIVVVAQKNALAKDIESFALEVAKIVKEKTGIVIEREVQYVS